MTITDRLRQPFALIEGLSTAPKLLKQRILRDPESSYFTLPSGRNIRVRHDSEMNDNGLFLRYSLSSQEIVISPLAEKFVLQHLLGSDHAKQLLRSSVKHEYTHMVVDEVFGEYPDLVTQLYSLFSSASFAELGNEFALSLVKADGYKTLYQHPQGLYRAIGILHEFFAFAAQGEDTEVSHSNTPQIGPATALIHELQRAHPDIYMTLVELGVVNNPDFAKDYPIILKNMEKVALKAEIKAHIRRR